jgi:hypothetical protein
LGQDPQPGGQDNSDHSSLHSLLHYDHVASVGARHALQDAFSHNLRTIDETERHSTL